MHGISFDQLSSRPFLFVLSHFFLPLPVSSSLLTPVLHFFITFLFLSRLHVLSLNLHLGLLLHSLHLVPGRVVLALSRRLGDASRSLSMRQVQQRSRGLK